MHTCCLIYRAYHPNSSRALIAESVLIGQEKKHAAFWSYPFYRDQNCLHQGVETLFEDILQIAELLVTGTVMLHFLFAMGNSNSNIEVARSVLANPD